MADSPTSYAAPAEARVGHVHLQVADLSRALAFYQGLLGFELNQRFGEQAAFLGAGGYHHHIGLNTWNSLGGPPARTQGAGLFHAAFLYPTRADLGRVVGRLVAAGYPLTGSADHGVSEAVYLNDPDGNGVELYRDRPREEWPRDAQGGIAMYTHPLDLRALVADGQTAA